MSDSDSAGRPRWTRGDEEKPTGAVELGALTRPPGSDVDPQPAGPTDVAPTLGEDSDRAPEQPTAFAPAPDTPRPAEAPTVAAPAGESPLQGAPWPKDAAPAGARSTLVLAAGTETRADAPLAPETGASSSGGPRVEARAAPAEPRPVTPPHQPAAPTPEVGPAAARVELSKSTDEPIRTSAPAPAPQASSAVAAAPEPPRSPAPPPSRVPPAAPYAQEEPSAAEVHHSYLAGVDPRVTPREKRGRGRLLIGAAALALLGVLAAAAFWPRGDEGRDDGPAVATQQETGSVTEAGLYLPPDREAVRDAYAEVGRVYRVAGVTGLAEAAQRCFSDLTARPTYRGLDYCSAVDAFGAAFARRAAGAPPPPESWFGQAESRYLQTAGLVMGPERDAAARLVDIRRLAIEVARESGPAFAAAAPQAPPAGASSVQVETVEPSTSPQTGPAQQRAPQGLPAQAAPQTSRGTSPAAPRDVETASGPAPARPARQVDRDGYAAARRPEAGPTAAEVAAARPRPGSGPSFNCRSARTQSERLVCADPDLARLDRRLNAAFEDAIAAGADRRGLRSEQDQWLAVRERAAPDPDAVADAYRRRIEELDAYR